MKHTWFKCSCYEAYCPFCEGGLARCTVCNGFEGTLPTEWPGEKMTEAQGASVYAAELDFKDGQWITGTNVGPMARINANSRDKNQGTL